jgi:hypothetical protein
MYTLIRHAGPRTGLLVEAPAMLLSLVLAELFYKFHSFTLECAAFLATWFVLSTLFSLFCRVWSRGKEGADV